MTTNQLAIEATGLVKSFGETRAVDGVDLAVRTGLVYGVLGPNGAGKTTTIRMLATLLRPDAGQARVLGHDIVQRGRRGSRRGQPDRPAGVGGRGPDRPREPDPDRPAAGPEAREAKARADELLEAFGLADAAGRLVKNYSGGMRRRLDIAASLVVTPQLMFLDEPTTGLDPRSRNQVWDIIRALVRAGTTILLCTQYLEEADQLADGIAVIDHGKVIAEGTPAQLKASVGSGALHVRLLDPEQRPVAVRSSRRQLARCTSSRTRPPSRRPAATPTGRPRPSGSCRVGRRRGGLLARPAQPGRGLPGSHRTSRRGGRTEERATRGGSGMSTAQATQEPVLQEPAAQGADVLASAPRQRALGHPHLRLARDAEGEARARAAHRRDDHPGDVHAAVHLSLRRRNRRLDQRLPRLHPPRRPRHRRCSSPRSIRASRSTPT